MILDSTTTCYHSRYAGLDSIPTRRRCSPATPASQTGRARTPGAPMGKMKSRAYMTSLYLYSAPRAGVCYALLDVRPCLATSHMQLIITKSLWERFYVRPWVPRVTYTWHQALEMCADFRRNQTECRNKAVPGPRPGSDPGLAEPGV